MIVVGMVLHRYQHAGLHGCSPCFRRMDSLAAHVPIAGRITLPQTMPGWAPSVGTDNIRKSKNEGVFKGGWRGDRTRTYADISRNGPGSGCVGVQKKPRSRFNEFLVKTAAEK